MFTSLKLCTITPLLIRHVHNWKKKSQQTKENTHVQYTQTDTIRQTDGPLVPMVPIEKGVFPTLRKQPTFHDANTGFHSK